MLAISDGIMNNDAFKHNNKEPNNETWTNLLRELKYFEDTDDHIGYMRRRFVQGAFDWMAGKNGSKQNYKVFFGYTDVEWEYIWSTLSQDGAWAVPNIKDLQGKVIKENWAPEIMIKFIAHDLRCNIIVFDLMLDRIQFISGNHVADDNVIFDSPLLLYSTGSHFQTVFQTNHEFFSEYAKTLDKETNTSPVLSGANDLQVCDKEQFGNSKQKGNKDEYDNSDDCLLSLEELKKIKAKDRTDSQQKRYKHLMNQARKAKETKDEAEKRKLEERQAKAEYRSKETTMQKERRRQQNSKFMAKKRSKETIEEQGQRKQQNSQFMAKKRSNETTEEKEKRKKTGCRRNRREKEEGNTRRTTKKKEAGCRCKNREKKKGDTGRKTNKKETGCRCNKREKKQRNIGRTKQKKETGYRIKV